jgi:hypothetical protein
MMSWAKKMVIARVSSRMMALGRPMGSLRLFISSRSDQPARKTKSSAASLTPKRRMV